MICQIAGVEIRPLTKYNDERGWLMELFRADELEEGNIPLMSYISITKPGAKRGPHAHKFQSDLFGFIGLSKFRLYLWDNRENSDTYKTSCKLDFNEDNPSLVIIPPGVVHGYVNIGNVDGLIFNSPNRLYKGENKVKEVDEIRYEDDPVSGFIIP